MHNKSYNYKNVVVALAIVATPYTAMAQVEGSALDHMLQRPRVSKMYKHKKAFDHFFIDGGLGVNFLGTRELPDVGPSAEIGFGDWISPEHGFRINITAGEWNVNGMHPKYVDASLDYLLNITAVGAPGMYYMPRRFELIGLAGVDFGASHYDVTTETGFGVHLGLRGQLALSKYSYAYLEPRFGLIQDEVTQFHNVHGYRPHGSIFLGFGYRLPEERLKAPAHEHKSFTDGLFFSVMGGPALLANTEMSTWGGRFGGRLTASVGKWFDSYNAVRLSANATSIYQYNAHNNIEALGLQLDYMANLSNLFGGINPARRFWVDFVAGVSYNASSDEKQGRQYAFGIGGGLQANVRLARGLTLSIEPRVDLYNGKYAPSSSSFRNYDVTGAILAGLTYTYNDRRIANVTDADDIRHCALTLVGGVANTLPYLGNKHYYAPMGRLSFERWYAPVFGWRANVQGMMRSAKENGSKLVGGATGLDWMMDLTALSCGYDVTQPLRFKTIAGFNLGAEYDLNEEHHLRFTPDVHAGIQMGVRLNNSLHLVAEPQVAFKTPRHTSTGFWNRFMPSMAVGLEYNMMRSNKKADAIDTPSKNDFVSVSVGTGVYTGNYSSMSTLGDRLSFIGEVGYGHWFNGISGINVSLGNSTIQRYGKSKNQNITSLSAGYMMNIKAAALNESTDGDLVQLTGIADLSLVGSKSENQDMKLTFGGKLALQLGFQVSKSVEIYAEPSATIYPEDVEPLKNSPHPLEGELRLSIGTKYKF
jgi:hypothetical protein